MNKSKPGNKMMSENIVLDRSILNLTIVEVDKENITGLIGLFIEELNTHLDQISRAAKEPNFAALARSRLADSGHQALEEGGIGSRIPGFFDRISYLTSDPRP